MRASLIQRQGQILMERAGALQVTERYVIQWAEVRGIFGFGHPEAGDNECPDQRWKRTERRANKLLRAHLSKRQLSTLDRHGWINVRGNHTGRLYRIDCGGCAHNIFSRGVNYCTMMDASAPVGDHLLAQKLLIETNERKFLKIAVRS